MTRRLAWTMAVAALLLPGLPAAATVVAPTDESVLRDSFEATVTRHDWAGSVLWAERLGVRRPFDPRVLLARGMAWSNLARAREAGRQRERPALRTSLERAACVRRAFALMDSSAVIAGASDAWLDAGERLAQLYETLGLPGDALMAYARMRPRAPTKLYPAMRLYWLRANLEDPIHPDTSEWRGLRRRLGAR